MQFPQSRGPRPLPLAGAALHYLVRPLICALGKAYRLLTGPDPDMRPFTGRGRALDGGTIVFDDLTVLLYGAELPRPGSYASRAARTELARIISGATLHVTPQRRDGRGRLLAHILLPDGRDLAQALIRHGVLRAQYTAFDLYGRDQAQAQRRGAGLWAAPGAPGSIAKSQQR